MTYADDARAVGAAADAEIAALKARIAELEKPPTTPPPTTPPPSGAREWISGACSVEPSAVTGSAFGDFRGEPATAFRFWLSPKSNMLLAGYYFDDKGMDTWTNGILDYAIGGPTTEIGKPKGQVWQAAATGGWDSVWISQCRQLHEKWGSIKQVHLSMAHECTGDWYDWSILGYLADYKTAYRRFANIVKTELKDKGRNVKLVTGYALSQPNVAASYPGDDVIDIIGFDTYDLWQPTSTGHILTEADWTTYTNRKLSNGDPAGPDAFAEWAKSHGKPFSVPEWGLADGGWTQYTDNPFYIQKMNDFFRRRAPLDKWNPGPGEVALECIFSDPGYALEIFPNQSKNPKAVAAYKSLSWGK